METFFLLIVAALWMIAFKLPNASQNPPPKPPGPPPQQPQQPIMLPPADNNPIMWNGRVYLPQPPPQGPPQIGYRPGGWMQ